MMVEELNKREGHHLKTVADIQNFFNGDDGINKKIDDIRLSKDCKAILRTSSAIVKEIQEQVRLFLSSENKDNPTLRKEFLSMIQSAQRNLKDPLSYVNTNGKRRQKKFADNYFTDLLVLGVQLEKGDLSTTQQEAEAYLAGKKHTEEQKKLVQQTKHDIEVLKSEHDMPEDDSGGNKDNDEGRAIDEERLNIPGYPSIERIGTDGIREIAQVVIGVLASLNNGSVTERQYRDLPLSAMADIQAVIGRKITNYKYYSFFNQDNGYLLPEYAGLDEGNKNKNDLLKTQARNRNLLKYSFAVAQVAMLLDCGYIMGEIVLDPDNGLAYPKGIYYQKQEYDAYFTELTAKIAKYKNEKPYKVIFDKMQTIENSLQGTIYQQGSNKGSQGRELFRRHYSDYMKLKKEIGQKEKTLHEVLDSARKQQDPVVHSVLGTALGDAVNIFGVIKEKVEKTNDATEEEVASYFVMLNFFSSQQSLVQKCNNEITGEKKSFGEQALKGIEDVLTKITQGKDPKSFFLNTSEIQILKGFDASVKADIKNVDMSKFDSYKKYISHETLCKLQTTGLYISSGKGMKKYAPLLDQAMPDKAEFDQRNADFVAMKNGGVLGRTAYISYSMIFGSIGALTAALHSPVRIFDQVDIAWTDDIYASKYKNSADQSGFSYKILGAIQPPSVMTDFFSEGQEPKDMSDLLAGEWKLDAMNTMGLTAKTLTDVRLLLRGGQLMGAPLLTKLQQWGVNASLAKYTANTLATMTTGNLMHLGDHMKTANDAGLTKGESLSYGLYAAMVEALIESAGGLTASNVGGGEILGETIGLLNKHVVKRYADIIRKGFVGGIWEGGEEVLNQGVMDKSHGWINAMSATTFKGASFAEYVEMAMLGAIAGKILTFQSNATAMHKVKQMLAGMGIDLNGKTAQALRELSQQEQDVVLDILVEVLFATEEGGSDGAPEQLTPSIIQAIEGKEEFNNKSRNRQAVYNNLSILNDELRVSGAIASLQQQSLLPQNLSEEQKKQLAMIILDAHGHRNNRPEVNADGTSRIPLAVVKDAEGNEVLLFPLSPEDRNKKYADLKGTLGKLGLTDSSDVPIDITMIAQVLMREGWCGTVRELRDYQEKAVNMVMDIVTQWLQASTLSVTERNNINAILKKQVLLEMATGSGKTFTVASILNAIDQFREEYIKQHPEKAGQIPMLNVLFFSHQIAITDQHHADLFHGKSVEDKPLLSQSIIDNAHSAVYHSNVKEVDSITGEEEETGEDTAVTENGGNGSNGSRNHQFVFATHQTAAGGLNGFIPNIIIVDEAHHASKPGTNYAKVIQQFSAACRTATGIDPLVINLSATPTQELRDRAAENHFVYSLPEYLASPHSPNVEYRAVGFGNMTQTFINQELQRIVTIKNKNTRELQLKELKEKIQRERAKFDNPAEMVEDLYSRLEGDFSQTVVFAKSIDEADAIARLINHRAGAGTAEAMHSRSSRKTKDILSDYKAQKVKTIVVVDQLNESIDLPETKNIVFARGTDSDRIFKQQLGRGLRGTGIVRIRDYVGSIVNLTKINEINDGMRKIQQTGSTGTIADKKQIAIFEGSDNMPLSVADQGSGIMYTIDFLDTIIDTIVAMSPEKARQGFLTKYGRNLSGPQLLSIMKMKPSLRSNDIFIKVLAEHKFGDKRKNTHEQWFALLKDIYSSSNQAIDSLSPSVLTYFSNLENTPVVIPPSPSDPTSNPPSVSNDAPTRTMNTIPNPEQSLRKLGYAYITIPGTIIPATGLSSDMKEVLQGGDGSGARTEQHYDRVGAFLSRCKGGNISFAQGDIVVGSVDPNGFRQTSYVAIYLKAYDKTVFLCNQYANATFILNGKIDNNQIITLFTKSDLKNDDTVKRVTFTAGNPEGRMNSIIELLGPKKQTETVVTADAPQSGLRSYTEYPSEVQALISKRRKAYALGIDVFAGASGAKQGKLSQVLAGSEFSTLLAAAGIELKDRKEPMTGNIKASAWLALMKYIYGDAAIISLQNTYKNKFKNTFDAYLKDNVNNRFTIFAPQTLAVQWLLGISSLELTNAKNPDVKESLLRRILPQELIDEYDKLRDNKQTEEQRLQNEQEAKDRETRRLIIDRMMSRGIDLMIMKDTSIVSLKPDKWINILGANYTCVELSKLLEISPPLENYDSAALKIKKIYTSVFGEAVYNEGLERVRKNYFNGISKYKEEQGNTFDPELFLTRREYGHMYDDTIVIGNTYVPLLFIQLSQPFADVTDPLVLSKAMCEIFFGAGSFDKAISEYRNKLKDLVPKVFDRSQLETDTNIITFTNDAFSVTMQGAPFHLIPYYVFRHMSGIDLAGLSNTNRKTLLLDYIYGKEDALEASDPRFYGETDLNSLLLDMDNHLKLADFIKEDCIRFGTKHGGTTDTFTYTYRKRSRETTSDPFSLVRMEGVIPGIVQMNDFERRKAICNYLFGNRGSRDVFSAEVEKTKQQLRAKIDPRRLIIGEVLTFSGHINAQYFNIITYTHGTSILNTPITSRSTEKIPLTNALKESLGMDSGVVSIRDVYDALGYPIPYDTMIANRKQEILNRLARDRITPAKFIESRVDWVDIGGRGDIQVCFGVKEDVLIKGSNADREAICDAIFGKGSYKKAKEDKEKEDKEK